MDYKKLKGIFAGYNEIKAAYLFGSYAEGKQSSDSDLDLGVLLEEGYSKMIKLDILTKLTQNNFDHVDLVIINNASILVKYEVIKHNRLIYRSVDFDSSAFYSKTIRQYLDFKPYLEVQRMYLKERIINA